VLLEALGASEGGPFAVSVTLPGAAPNETSHFSAGPETVLLTDDAQEILAWGSPGIHPIAYGGPLPREYYKDPEKTAETFTEIGGKRYLLTGDWASIREDGAMVLIGRGNTCINTGGEKVFPQEVEEVLKLHAAVADAVVVGVPDEKFGSAVTAVVSAAERQPTLDELAGHTKAHLAGFKQPRRLVIVPRVKRGPSGKTDYRWAREVAMSALGLSSS
jgi:fatty-acyl-CoA synthase